MVLSYGMFFYFPTFFLYIQMESNSIFSPFLFLFSHVDKYVYKQDSWETVKMVK